MPTGRKGVKEPLLSQQPLHAYIAYMSSILIFYQHSRLKPIVSSNAFFRENPNVAPCQLDLSNWDHPHSRFCSLPRLFSFANCASFSGTMTEIPSVFMNNEWFQESAENLDEFLAAKGVPWLVRKLISLKTGNGYFNLTKNGDKYKIVNWSTKNKKEYEFTVGEPVTASGYDGKQHKICFSMNGDRFREQHEHLEGDRKGETDDITEYFMQDGRLVAESSVTDKSGNTVTWRRYYKRN
uniref:FABP domain-containing protein n=1 Tax=Steinernema glaseri TaxID=37863 RepID=A0A1I7YNE7_9BILA